MPSLVENPVAKQCGALITLYVRYGVETGPLVSAIGASRPAKTARPHIPLRKTAVGTIRSVSAPSPRSAEDRKRRLHHPILGVGCGENETASPSTPDSPEWVGSCRSRWTPPGVSVKNPDTDFGEPSNVSFGSIPDLPATLGRCRRIGRIGSREAAKFGNM